MEEPRYVGLRSSTRPPKDGRPLRLYVDYTVEGAAHPLEDAEAAWTVGWNSYEHTGEDVWHLVGWCWSHDHITEGRGRVIAWAELEWPVMAPDSAA